MGGAKRFDGMIPAGGKNCTNFNYEISGEKRAYITTVGKNLPSPKKTNLPWFHELIDTPPGRESIFTKSFWRQTFGYHPPRWKSRGRKTGLKVGKTIGSLKIHGRRSQIGRKLNSGEGSLPVKKTTCDKIHGKRGLGPRGGEGRESPNDDLLGRTSCSRRAMVMIVELT